MNFKSGKNNCVEDEALRNPEIFLEITKKTINCELDRKEVTKTASNESYFLFHCIHIYLIYILVEYL